MNKNELVAERNDHFSAASKLYLAARDSGKDIAGAQLAEYNQHIEKVKSLDALIK